MIHNTVLEPKKLETLLIKNWTSFIDVRKLIHYISELTVSLGYPPSKVTKVSLSRFELTDQGFLIWINYILAFPTKQVNLTSEFSLTSNGLQYIQSVES